MDLALFYVKRNIYLKSTLIYLKLEMKADD